MLRKANTIPSPGAPNGHQALSNDATPKGRYKSVLLSPRLGMPSSSTLTPGFLHSFGFSKTRSSSEAEAAEPSVESSQQTASSLETDEKSKDTNSLLLQQESNFKAEKHDDLSESQLNLLSHNLSEIADRISPSKYDPVFETDCESLETLTDDNLGQSSQAAAVFSHSEQSRFKTPYSRRRRDSKSYVSKQKSFTRKRSQGHHSSQQEMNNDEISIDATNIISLTNPETFKQLDSESDSGYSSSMSTSISLSEEIEASKRLSLENGSITDIDTDDLAMGGDDLMRRNSEEKAVVSRDSSPPLLHRNSSDLGERLDSLIHGVSSGIDKLNLNGGFTAEKEDLSQGGVSNGLNEPSETTKSSFSDNQLKDQLKDKSKELSDKLAKPPFPLRKGKVSSDDTAVPRTKTGKRPGILRRRTTLVSFRPPKQMAVQEGESDVVEMDEVGFMQMLTDVKSLKTQLLKLKRELQEADVVSPLLHSHSCAARRASISVDSDPSLDRATMVHRKRMLLSRTMTMDAAAMHEKRIRSRSFNSSLGEAEESLKDITELSESRKTTNHAEPVATATNVASAEEVKKLREELGEVKNQLIDITQERNSLMIEREELEHELDSKNHTIRMLQKQLEAQDNRDEIAYFKRQVKSLTDQIQQQQQKITMLRYRSTSPGPVPLGTIPNFQNKKETVKADIRNRLRDAFVRHLGESSKSHVQLSKHIQKAEQNITMAQKGLSSLYSSSSPVLSPHASTAQHLPKDKSRPSFERSDSQSSVERSQDESDGRGYESDSSRSGRRAIPSSGTERNAEDSGSESGRSGRIRRSIYPGANQSQEESDGRMSDSDSGKPSRRRVASPPFERDPEKLNSSDLESDSGKTGIQIEVTDMAKGSKQNAPPSLQRTRKLSRSKLLSKIESSPLSHSWTPGAIEKIVKSWREAKSPEAQEKAKEDDSNLKPVSHVQFL